MQLTQPVSHTFYSQRLRLHYVEWINQDAPPLIMVHGGADHCRSWDWIARELNNRFNVLAPDLRGHGDSSWSNATYRKLDFVYDLNQLISAKGYKKVTIVAHSMGAWVSLLYAGLKPETVEKLVVIDGLVPLNKGTIEKMKNPRARRLNDWIDVVSSLSASESRKLPTFEAALQRLHAANTKLSQEQARHLTEYAIKQNEDGTYSWKFDKYMRSLDDAAELSEAEIIEIRSRISCPILLLQGMDSPFFQDDDSEYIQTLQNCKVINFPDTGHWLHHEHTSRVVEELNTFLNH